MKNLQNMIAEYLPSNSKNMDDLKLVDAKAKSYMYWNHKYSEGNEAHENNVVALQFQHSMIKAPFWIVLFKGAGYSESDIVSVNAFEELPVLDDAIEQDSGISLDDTKLEGIIEIMAIVDAFKHHWFEENEKNESEPLIYEDCYALESFADVIMNEGNLVVDINVPLAEVTKYHIEMLENALKKAKENREVA